MSKHVNKQGNIPAFFFGCYLALLPVVVAWHSVQHSFADHVKDDGQGITVSFEINDDCEICEYYFNKWAYITYATNQYFYSFSTLLKEKKTKRFYVRESLQNQLRGPPEIRPLSRFIKKT